jgi:hypothetical protein
MEAQGDSSKPFVQITSDAGHFEDDLRDEVAEALRPYFNVKSGRLYQFAESPPAKVIIEFGVPLLIFIQSVGINVLSSALWDGLKLFLQEKKPKSRSSHTSSSQCAVPTEPRFGASCARPTKRS